MLAAAYIDVPAAELRAAPDAFAEFAALVQRHLKLEDRKVRARAIARK